jgi:hypothetical protein
MVPCVVREKVPVKGGMMMKESGARKDMGEREIPFPSSFWGAKEIGGKM